MSAISVSIEKDLVTCKELWNQFSPQKTLWELWDIAICFYNQQGHTPYFIVIKEDQKIRGILPLWYELSEQRYLFFGGSYLEDMTFWFDHVYFESVFEYIPKKTFLFFLSEITVKNITHHYPLYKNNFYEDEAHYFLNFTQYENSIENFFATFSKKHRKNLRYDLTQFEKQGIQEVWCSKVVGFEEFVEFNIQRFEDSDFTDPMFKEGIKKVLEYLEKEKMLHTLCLYDEKTLVGVEYAAFYKGIYYLLNGGYNQRIPNIGKAIIMKHLTHALECGARIFDLLSNEQGSWKDLWNFSKQQYYTFEKS